MTEGLNAGWNWISFSNFLAVHLGSSPVRSQLAGIWASSTPSPSMSAGPPTPKVTEASLDDVSRARAVITKVAQLYDNSMTITYSFFGGTENQKMVVDDVAVMWTYYANLILQREEDEDKEAMVHIAFQAKSGSRSSIGKPESALRAKSGAITMNLSWLEDSPFSETNKDTILHEWGHAFVLIHEHASPAISTVPAPK
ncbi:hypothetical protein FPV67DRAFT_1669026 [Lyophyllum atratum]|nr:hypothetical protein FPV67DRAFT_1669026 [Lyophyllum atratum]